jgi:glutaredoxin 3
MRPAQPRRRRASIPSPPGPYLAGDKIVPEVRKEVAAVAKIEIYTTPFCPYCARAKALLAKKTADFVEYDVSSMPGARAEMQERSGGKKTVPQIFVDGRHVGDSDGIVALERAGKLDAVLRGEA